MIQFTTTIQKFGKKGEKTGWTYIEIPASKAAKLKPDSKVSFRVKGNLDQLKIEKTALIPMGEGNLYPSIEWRHEESDRKKARR